MSGSATLPAGVLSGSAQISALGFVSSSVTASSLVTASFSGNTLTFTKGDSTTFGVVIPDVSGSTINTGSFATTGSNTFTGVQNFNADITASNTIINGDLTVNPNTVTNLNGNANVQNFLYVGGGLTLNNTAAITWLGSGIIDSTFSSSVDARILAAGGAPQVQDEGTILGNATSFDFNGAGVTATISAGTASITIPGGGTTINTGSFATTGSNAFVGNQTISGSLTISGSAQSDLTVVGQIFVSSSATAGTTTPRITVSGSAGTSTINRNSISTRNATDNGGMFPSTIYTQDSVTTDEIGFTVDPSVFGITEWSTGPAFYVNNTAGDTYPAVFGFQNKANYTDGRVEVLTPLIAQSGSVVTGSVSITEVIKLKEQATLPAGDIGDLAVSASNLYFYSGSAWNKIAFA